MCAAVPSISAIVLKELVLQFSYADGMEDRDFCRIGVHLHFGCQCAQALGGAI